MEKTTICLTSEELKKIDLAIKNTESITGDRISYKVKKTNSKWSSVLVDISYTTTNQLYYLGRDLEMLCNLPY